MGRTLAGRNAVVTGAGSGIGKGIARRFATEGASVIVAEFDEASGRACVAEIAHEGSEARFVHVDVTDRNSVLELMTAAGPVDILVNNAWRGTGIGRIERKSDEQFDQALRFGVHACQWTMQAALPHMRLDPANVPPIG